MNAPFTNGRELADEKEADEWLMRVRRYLRVLSLRKKQQFNRRVSIGDLLSERAENAAAYGFGEGTTMYDNVLVLGQVEVGRHTWIGPGCILDGSGGRLRIGDHCSISAGVQIYTHHTVNRSLSMGAESIAYASTTIGDGVYLGPNVVIQMGVTIGNRVVVGANSFVNRDIGEGQKAFGTPARIQGGVLT
ncbi:acyltransferase [Tardiphaga sp. P9-11]|jgi:acetyltransferase-like isoleucine patch superfamily enzyme|uniref:acyltransferase n=1 Tax=Tardiphaga sp. P9-11 TaxID=2024614 RepID=UPI0011F19C19|nr:acyltransferase [Tardiphaga sp. P9-11]KAA0072989.1 acyltransferase [Tardiphaga sp. P9-11]